MKGSKWIRAWALVLSVAMLAACSSGGKKQDTKQTGQTQTQTTQTQQTTKGPILPQGNVKPNLANDPLKAQVDAGKLPSLDKRLPEKPVVLPVREAIGVYGGTINTFVDNADHAMLRMWLYDPPVRWKEDYSGYEPNLAESFEWSADGKTITFKFRKGLKWSDGKPFTTEDLRFWWEDLATYKDSGYSVPWWGRNKDQTPMEVKILNETDISFTFKEPNYTAPYILAQGFWEWDALMKPKHYLSQFHPKYNKDMPDFAKLREMDNYIKNPAMPTLFAWDVVEYEAGKRAVLERNPYYWKLDPQGNQLPYVDKIISYEIADAETRLLKTLNGEFDLTVRGINPRNLRTLIQNESKGNYKVLRWTNGAGGWPGLLVNQDFVGDEYIRGLLRDKRFRQAFSMAIDRENANEAIWNGGGTVQQGTISKESPHFADAEGQKIFKQWQEAYAKKDVAAANKLLDEIGLTKKDAKGFRMRPDGKPLEIVVDVTNWGQQEINAQAAALIKKDMEAVGLNIIINNVPDTDTQRFPSAQWMLSFAHGAELDLFTYPDWVFPVRGNRAWPLQGLWFESGGEKGEKPFPNSPAQVLNDFYRKGLSMKSLEEKNKVVQEATKYLIQEGPFYIGITGGIPEPVIARTNLKNVPQTGVLGPWAPGSPGNLNINTVFFAK